jgi:hypothetical protein
VIASVAQVAVFVGCVLEPLKVSNGHYPVLGALVCELCLAKMVLGLRWRGVAVEGGLLYVVATGRGPGFHGASTSHAICARFLCGPLNSRVGSAIEHAAVVVVGWVAWRRACNVRKIHPSAKVESRVTLVALEL